VRHWRRYQAVLLRADGVLLATVAQTLGCTQASVCNWTRAWREQGARGVAEGTHPEAERRLNGVAAQALERLLEQGDPQAHGYAATNWTAPLLRTELAKQGWSASERTLRARCTAWATAGSGPNSCWADRIQRTRRKKPWPSKRQPW